MVAGRHDVASDLLCRENSVAELHSPENMSLSTQFRRVSSGHLTDDLVGVGVESEASEPEASEPVAEGAKKEESAMEPSKLTNASSQNTQSPPSKGVPAGHLVEKSQSVYSRPLSGRSDRGLAPLKDLSDLKDLKGAGGLYGELSSSSLPSSPPTFSASEQLRRATIDFTGRNK
jgi:hypothetical protein